MILKKAWVSRAVIAVINRPVITTRYVAKFRYLSWVFIKDGGASHQNDR